MSTANDTAAPAADTSREVLFTGQRTRDLRVEVSFVLWNKHARVDIREYIHRHGAWRAQPKGTSIKVHELDAVIDALTALRDRMVAK